MRAASNCAHVRPREATFETRVRRAGHDALVVRSEHRHNVA